MARDVGGGGAAGSGDGGAVGSRGGAGAARHVASVVGNVII